MLRGQKRTIQTTGDGPCNQATERSGQDGSGDVNTKSTGLFVGLVPTI